MKLRDHFAGQALTGYAANSRVMDKAIDEWEGNGGPRPHCIAEWLAGLAYEVADAMLAARARPKGRPVAKKKRKVVTK